MKNFVVHNSVHVADLERSIEFYQKAFGFVEKNKLVQPDDSISSFLTMEGDSFIVQLNWCDDEAVVKTTQRNHLAIETDEWDELYQHHVKMDCISEGKTGIKSYFVEDPDGNSIEVLNKYR